MFIKRELYLTILWLLIIFLFGLSVLLFYTGVT